MTTPNRVAPSVTARRVAQTRTGGGRRMNTRTQILLQPVCFAIGSKVLFPSVWILGMYPDPRPFARAAGRRWAWVRCACGACAAPAGRE